MISVVVPIYNVEAYLEECLDSLLRQTVPDLEVVLVDDGSTDGSADIARAYVDRDPRLRLVTQPNAGLGAARNTGTAHATGEFLAYLDSDDLLPHDAYERLLGALEQTGSDFATGNVERLTSEGRTQAKFLQEAFSETRLRTHVTRHRALIADRTAWNKLFRRSFWDAHGFRFPVGVTYEDTPVILPAHFSAKSVDAIAEPVYVWRFREEGAQQSITQKRIEPRSLADRLAAVEQVREFLRRNGPADARRWYDESLVGDDLRLYLNVFDEAGPEFRALFLERVNALLDSADDDIYDSLMAIDRLKWHLVRRRMVDELVEVLRFQRKEMPLRAPVKVGRQWYGDYPFRDDPARNIPSSVYRLNRLPSPIVRLGWRVPAPLRRRIKSLTGGV